MLRRLGALSLALALAACAAEPQNTAPVYDGPVEYQAREDGSRIVPAINTKYLNERNARRWVDYNGPERVGTIVVDPYARVLYHVYEPGRAMRFGIAVGKAGLGFAGNGVIQRKVEYPGWTPTANMIRREPDVYGPLAGGLKGGLDNPLGARALYLYRNGKDTMYRIHGTMDPSSIGKATSAGCIRLFNQDVIDAFDEVPLGTFVKVRTKAESEKLEGKFTQLSTGYLVPEGSFELIEADRLAAEAEGAAAAAAAEEAEQHRADIAAAREAALTGQ